MIISLFGGNTGSKSLLAGLLLIIMSAALPVMAQDNMKSGLIDDFLKVQGMASDKAVQLAGAFPADKYDWRPAEGVRSVKEVIMHIAAANYNMAALLGTPVPEGVDTKGMENTTDSKEKIIETLKQSIDHVQGVIKNLKPEDFDQEVKFFGMTGTKRQVMFIIGDHAAEHLGQLIAYARMNGVVPPWSMKK